MKGDFMGFAFTWGGTDYKSSDLGITRTSGGDRYEESLIPEINDKTVEVPGIDGVYFYGSDFKDKKFTVNFAYDKLTEEQFRKLRQVFGYKHTGLLTFDERPYKVYRVKVASPIELEYVCFDERKRVASDVPRDGVRWTQHEEWTIRNGEIFKSIDAGAENEEVVISEPTLQVDSIEVSFDDEEGVLTYTKDGATLYFTNRGVDSIQVTISYQYLERTQEGEHEQVYPYEYVMEDTDEDGNADSYVYERIYKGEGSIEFAAYYPFARQKMKFLDSYTLEEYPNKKEWAASSRLQESRGSLDTYITNNNGGTFTVYNAGDVPTGFRLFIPFNAEHKIPRFTLGYDMHVGSLTVDEITRVDDTEIGVQINTVNGLIEGVSEFSIVNDSATDFNSSILTSGHLYNFSAVGEFFKIEPELNVQTLTINGEIPTDVSIGSDEDARTLNPTIYYDYLYF